MTTSVPFLVMALVLVLLGMWGRRHAIELAPASLPDTEREHRAKIIRRGAVSAYVVAAAFCAMAVFAAF